MNKIIADRLFNDPTIEKAKKQILTTIEQYKANITHIQPPRSSLKSSYEETVKQLGRLRGQDLFFPYIGSGFGNGVFVELADGSIKYDFISGIGTHWGHFHPKLIEESLHASIHDSYMQTNLQQNRDVYTLITLLTKNSGLDHCFLTSSGAMANENALKLLYQKAAPADRILAFEGCFMGRTLALSQVTDRPFFREGLPINFHVDYVPFYDWRDPQGSTEIAVISLKKFLKRYPGKHACMCFELVQGEAGNYPGQKEFFISLMQVLKDHEISIFVDEVQTFGRTDHLFAFQHFGLEEYVDVVTCGKLMHTCATLFRKKFCPKPGLMSQTFISSTSSVRMAVAIIKSLLEENFLGKNGKHMLIRKHFVEHLQRLSHKYSERLEGPFGYGLMIACTPFKGEKKLVMSFAQALFDAGLMTFIAGHNPTRIRMLVPAGSITLEDIDAAMIIFENVLKEI